MFEKNLTDIIRGIRANKNNEEKYILRCIEEIRKEINDDAKEASKLSRFGYFSIIYPAYLGDGYYSRGKKSTYYLL